MALRRAPVYRNIELRQAVLGVELTDAIALGGVGVLLVLLNRSALAWNLAAVVVLHAAVRQLKRGKPEHHTTSLVRFHLRRPFWSAGAPDRLGRAHPFPLPARRSPAADPPGPAPITRD